MANAEVGTAALAGALSRRQFLKLVGAIGGGGAVMNAMTAFGMYHVSAQTEPPKLEGSGNGTSVLVLGGGPGGCPAAYELKQLGYDVTLLEAKDHLGGHAFTVRNGSKSHEYGGEEQVCTWDEGLWFDAGPSRIPFYHRGVLHYCKLFNIPMIDHKNLNLNSWVYAEGIDGALDGQKVRLHELQADMAGYVSELLAKAANQDALDDPFTADDRDMLIDYLVDWGQISPGDLTYTGSDRRGYEVLPDTQSPGTIGPPYPWKDLLPFAAATLGSASGYLSAAATFDWQTTLMKPVNGVGQLFTEGFANALGEAVKLSAPVTKIEQTEDQVTVTYADASGQSQQISADYCLCNIPLSVLIKIPVNWSSDMEDAIHGVPYDMAMRMGLAFKRRFWEEDDWIYGGQSFFNVPQIGIIGYPDNGYHTKNGVLLGLYNFDTDSAEVSAMSLAERTELALTYGEKIHGPAYRDEFDSSFSVAWHRMPYSLGAWPNYWTTNNRQDFFPRLQEPDGRIYLVGEHLSYVNAWMEGAFQSAWMQIEKLHQRVMSGG